MKKLRTSIRYILPLVLMIAALILYFINCNTQFYKSSGIDKTIVGMTLVAMVLELLICLLGKPMVNRLGEWITNIVTILPAVILMYVFMSLLNARIYSIATILTFESNAKNMADLRIAIDAMVCYLLALVLAVHAQGKLLEKEK